MLNTGSRRPFWGNQAKEISFVFSWRCCFNSSDCAATVSNGKDQFGKGSLAAQRCAQNVAGRSLGSQLLLPFRAGVFVP